MEQALIMVFVIAAVGDPSAGGQAAQAYLKQSGIEQNLNAYAYTITTDEQRRLIGDAAIVARMVLDRQVVYVWRF